MMLKTDARKRGDAGDHVVPGTAAPISRSNGLAHIIYGDRRDSATEIIPKWRDYLFQDV